MWAILHIPTGTFLVRERENPFEIYKENDRDRVITIFNQYCENGKVSSFLTNFIPYNNLTYSPDISEFEIVEID